MHRQIPPTLIVFPALDNAAWKDKRDWRAMTSICMKVSRREQRQARQDKSRAGVLKTYSISCDQVPLHCQPHKRHVWTSANIGGKCSAAILILGKVETGKAPASLLSFLPSPKCLQMGTFV